jgi:hypothetical protein
MDEIEAQKRANYFDLGRDDFMALEEYLLSGLSDKDLGKAEGGIVSLYSNGGKVKIPQLSTDVANISDVYEAIDDPSYVRDTTRISNLRRGSKVTRSMGYDKIFETFEKNKISKATIQKFKNIPKITDFDNAKDFSKALKKFRETAFKGLDNKQLNVIRSSGFLSNYAKDVRSALPAFGKGADKRMLNKALNDTFEYVFMSPDTAVGVKKPKIQSKVYTEIREMAKKTLDKAQRLNLDYALSQVDKLFKAGSTKKAQAMLAAIGTLVSKGAFGAVLKASGHPVAMGVGFALDAPMLIEAAEKVKEETIDPLIFESAEKMVEGENILKQMFMPKMDEGGMMDINDMTRPIGYNNGGDVTLEEIMRDMQDSQGPEEPGVIDTIIGNMSPIDPIFTAKEKAKDVGKSLLDKINDFLKYGHGDKEDYMEIGGEQVDPDDPNFRRFIEENYMGEGESYIEGIENYRMEVEGEEFQSGGIVSLDQMTRAL